VIEPIEWELFELKEAVLIPPNTKKVLRVTEAWTEPWEIYRTDPKRRKVVQALCFRVVEEDDRKVWKVWRIIQKRLIAILRPYVETGIIFKSRIHIFKHGFGPASRFEVFIEPLTD